MSTQFTTIGHSNRSLRAFVDILHEAQVKLVVDVRSFPRSRTNPVFNIECLPQELMQFQIGYRHCSALGGRRPKQFHVDENVNALWRVQSFHNYADYALGNEFATGFAELLKLGRGRRLTIMCSEAVWWRCHRRIITDYLLVNGHEVDHLMGPGQIDAAMLTPGAQRIALGKVTYPAAENS